MTARAKSAIKAFFETGDVPTESNFADLIDSYQDVSALLTAIASLTPTDSVFIVGNGTTFVAESGSTARASLGAMSATEPYYIQIALTPNGTAGSSGNGKGFARVPKAGNITGVVLDCDPNNEPSSIQIQADLNKVDRSTGTATSVLSAVAAISASANTGSGTVNGTQSVSAGDMLRVDLDQYADGNDVIMTVEITPT